MRARASTAIQLQSAEYADGALLYRRRGAAGRRGDALPQAVRASASDTRVGGNHRAGADTGAALVALAYELPDAHSDTAQLADWLPYDPGRVISFWVSLTQSVKGENSTPGGAG